MSLLEILANDSGSVEASLAAIEELCEELKNGQIEDWVNPTLLQYLEGMHAWLETMGSRIDERPSWKFFEIMIRSAKIYE